VSIQRSVERIQKHLDNPLTGDGTSAFFAGIFGAQPSRFAKSPGIWNSVYKELSAPGRYLPFDTKAERLGNLVDELRRCDDYVGGNVTVPHKVAIMPHLDEVDETARRIGAVNTIVRTPDGRIVGYNTDAEGALGSVLTVPPGSTEPLLSTLENRRVVLIGAGGAARAVAVRFAQAIGPAGRIVIANRTRATTNALVEHLGQWYRNAEAIDWDEIPGEAKTADLVVQASVVGQAGLRDVASGDVTCLEPYSPFAPVDAPAIKAEEGSAPARLARWTRAAQRSISVNNDKALERMSEVPATTAFLDIVFAPLETTVLRHARLTGHRTLNGKAMNVLQAADAFVNRVMQSRLSALGLGGAGEAMSRVMDIMYRNW
jgi:shikimate dehydrogenase